MSSNEIQSWITTLSVAIVAVCAILTLIRVKKYSITPEKIARWVAILAAVAVVAMVIGIIKSSITTVSAAVVAVCAILTLITIKKYSTTPEKGAAGVATLLTTVAVVAMAIGIMALFLNNLPVILGEVVKKECDIIAQKTKADIFKDARENHEKVITTLVDSEAVRKMVYRDAMDQADKEGYIFLIKGHYLTAYDWREKNRLLTEKQRRVIERCFFTKHLEEKDLYTLMYLVLSDEEVIEALKCKATFVHLTPYDIIGIVGGYLGELIQEMEQTKKPGSKISALKKYYSAPQRQYDREFCRIFGNRNNLSICYNPFQ